MFFKKHEIVWKKLQTNSISPGKFLLLFGHLTVNYCENKTPQGVLHFKIKMLNRSI